MAHSAVEIVPSSVISLLVGVVFTGLADCFFVDDTIRLGEVGCKGDFEELFRCKSSDKALDAALNTSVARISFCCKDSPVVSEMLTLASV